MPTVYFDPDEKLIEVQDSETLLAASLRAGVPHAHACGGNARCSTCRVSIEEGLENCTPRTEREQIMAERLHFRPEVRLACQTVATGDVHARRLVIDALDIELTKRMAEGEQSVSIGEEADLAILFADIRGFTAFSETLPPYDVIYILNRYFHEMSKAIERHGGYIDNIMGDGLIALFGIDDPDDSAYRAVRAGLEMLEEVIRLRPHFLALYDISFEIGVGIHYGQVVMGTVGAAGRQRKTVIGDVVNFASRIESANKEYGTHLLISEETYRRVAERVMIGQQIEHAIIKGKKGEHVLYEVTGLHRSRREV